MEEEDDDILLEHKFFIQPTFGDSDGDDDYSNANSLQLQSDKSTDNENEDFNFEEDSDAEAQATLKSLRSKILKRSDDNFKSKDTLNQTFPEHKSEFDNVILDNLTDYVSSESLYAPCYKNHQLIGDSQLLRFAEQLLHYKRNVKTECGSSGVGYCVSGQKISDLKRQLLKKQFEICDKIILLIGTNDLLYKVPLSLMCSNFHSILNILQNNAVQRIVVLTVPPVPKLANDKRHLLNLQQFNEFITRHAQVGKVFVVDLASLFISYNNTVAVDYFEKTFKYTNKPDFIHMNLDAFKMLQTLLNVSYFDKNF